MVYSKSQVSPGSSMLLWFRSPSLKFGSMVLTEPGRNAMPLPSPPSSVTLVRSICTAPLFVTRYDQTTGEPIGSTTPFG